MTLLTSELSAYKQTGEKTVFSDILCLQSLLSCEIKLYIVCDRMFFKFRVAVAKGQSLSSLQAMVALRETVVRSAVT